jgi:diaminopimelate epimerase
VKLLIGTNLVSVKRDKNDFVVENIFSLSPSEIGLNNDEQIFQVEFENKKISCFTVSIGNPHAVIFNDKFDVDVKKFGTFLQESNFFKNGVNVGFVQIKNAQEINLRVFERGVGETQACGSGACAAAVACAIQKGLAEELKINFHQGQVFTKVNLGDSKVMLQGNAEYRKQDVLLDL